MEGTGPTGWQYDEAVLNEAGDRLVWNTESPPNPDHWLLVEGRRLPVQGNAAILGKGGADPSVDLEWLKNNIDFGEVRDGIFWGDLHRRPVI